MRNNPYYKNFIKRKKTNYPYYNNKKKLTKLLISS